MDRQLFNFRHAREILAPKRAWDQLGDVTESMTRDDVIERQALLASRGRLPRGGQSAINSLFDERLIGWQRQPRLFGATRELQEWKMDFLLEGIGVEVSFNHAEAIAWQLTRLTIAGESAAVVAGSRIDVGVVITATRSLKAWSRMDGAVGTFDVFQAWMTQMKPILPIPILLIGLRADQWATTDVFPGPMRGSRGGAPAAVADPTS